MFLYTSIGKFQGLIRVSRLSASDTAWVDQAAEWTENKWGYIRGYPGIEKRKGIMRDLISDPINQFFMVTYANQPIGMFALSDYSSDLFQDAAATIKELKYFYVAISFRSMGIGSSMLAKIKEKAKEIGADMLVLDTLNPNLNQFYKKHGAKEVVDSQFFGQPTTLFRMDINTDISDDEMANSVFAQSKVARKLSACRK